MGFWSFMKNFSPVPVAAEKKHWSGNFSTGGWDGRQPDFWSSANLMNSLMGPVTSDREKIENGFEAYVESAYKRNGVIFACVQARMMAFSEATFRWRRNSSEGDDTGQVGELYGNVRLLDKPWPGGTTGELLSRMEQDASFAGNSWWTITDDNGNFGKKAMGPGRRLAHMRPDWVTMIIGQKGKSESDSDPFALDAQVLGYLYEPMGGSTMLGTRKRPESTVFLTPQEVAHYCPNPDPVARFRGMSWITSVIREIEADSAATRHKKAFFENAAVPNMAVKFDRETSEDSFREFVENFKEAHQGDWNAYKTLFLMGGADVAPLTHNFQQLEFTATQGKGEARIAMAAGVPGQWLGSSEGMQSSSLGANSLPAARRRFADGTIRPLWRIAAASLQNILDVPAGSHLWFDERDIAFLREDAKDQADILMIEMSAINVAIMAGWEPDASVDAVRTKDVGRLKGHHTGLVSVQMQAMQDAEERDARLDAPPIATLVQVGFTYESAVEAMATNDISKLKKDPKAAQAIVEGMGAPKPFGGGPQGAGQKPKPATDKPDKSHDPRAGESDGQ